MSGPDPATTEWVPIWNTQGAHHTTHEPGGTDVLTLSSPSLLIGRGNAGLGVGPIQEISLGPNLYMDGTMLRAKVSSSQMFNYDWSASSVPPPTSSQLRINAAHPYSAATELYVRPVTSDGIDVYWALMRIKSGTGLFVQDKNDHGLFIELKTSGVPVDNGTYITLPVTYLNSGSAAMLNNQQVVLVIGSQPDDGAPPALHHTTHEPGGTDVLVNAAWTNQANVFAVQQTFKPGLIIEAADTPYFYLFATGGPVDGKRWLIQDLGAGSGLLRIGALNDAANVWMGFVDISRGGALTTSGAVTSAGVVYPGRVDSPGYGQSQNNSYLGAHQSYGLISNTGLYLGSSLWAHQAILRTGLVVESGGASIAGTLTVNAVTVNAGNLNVSAGSILCSGYVQPASYVYPGFIDTPGVAQSSYFLAGHNAYGLYTNAHFYVVGNIYPTNVYARGSLYLSGRDDMLFASDAAGTYTNTTFQVRNGHIYSAYWMFPGALSNPGVVQTSWYLASHSSYGLFSNTGLYLTGGLWVVQNFSCGLYRSISLQGLTAGTQYYANQDGWLTVRGYYGDGGAVNVLAGPAGNELRGNMACSGGQVGYVAGTMTVPIKYGDYFQAYFTGNAGITGIILTYMGTG